jgi:sucrose-6-phosphate hydrolase SacC (GH32 family)
MMKGSGDYIVGSFDGHRFVPETDIIRTHWGASFYGAQTFSDAPDGRRVQIAWMPSGKEKAPNAWPGMPFNQQMSFPRELTLRSTPEGPRVFRQPIAEIKQLYAKAHDLKSGPLVPGANPLASLRHDLLDIELELELQQATNVSLNLRGEEILYDVKQTQLKAFGRTLLLVPEAGKLVLRVLLDRTSIELFAGGGQVTHSAVFFADPANEDLSLTVKGGPAHVLQSTN